MLLGVALILVANPEFVGNVALPDQLYARVLEDRDSAAPDLEADAAHLQAFLRAAGYDLAMVVVESESPPRLRIREGVLDRIIFIGAGGGTTLGFKLSFDLPGRVFNRSQVEDEIRRLVDESSSVASAHWELVPARKVDPSKQAIQLEPQTVGTVKLIRPGEDYELRIYVEAPEYAPGFDVGLGFGPPDGVFVNLRLKFANSLFEGDRMVVDTSLGVDFGDLADDPAARLGVTRAVGQVQWFTPPLGAPWLRSYLEFSAQALGRDRQADIGLDSYIFAPLAASANLQFEFDRLSAYIGGGVEQRFLFRARPSDAPDAVQLQIPDDQLEPDPNLRPFFSFGSRLRFAPKRLREDRQHQVQFDGRILGPGPTSEAGILDLRASYENVLLFGWDELVYRLSGAFLGGEVPYFNEVAFGDGFLRAAFLDEIYTTRIGSLRAEYRLSLSRDIFKLGFFNDIAVFERLGLDRSAEGPEFVESAGLGLHILALDVFQFSLYGGFGITSGLEADVDVSLSVNQVF
ncbi:MAG: hypothetical protein AAGD10_21355 [Myxococcota bacterium]